MGAEGSCTTQQRYIPAKLVAHGGTDVQEYEDLGRCTMIPRTRTIKANSGIYDLYTYIGDDPRINKNNKYADGGVIWNKGLGVPRQHLCEMDTQGFGSRMGYTELPTNFTIKQYEFKSGFGVKSKVDESNVNNIKKDPRMICFYKPNDDLYYINDNVIGSWIHEISQPKTLAYILSDIRKCISENPDFVLAHIMSKHYSSQRNVTRSYIDLPFGPPLLTLLNSYATGFKYHHSNYEVQTIQDGINVVKPIINEKSGYIDLVYSVLNTFCKIQDNTINDETVFSIQIPTKGSQLFDVIGESKEYSINDVVKVISYSDLEEDTPFSIYNTKLSRILLTFKSIPLALSSHYSSVTNFPVPVLTFSEQTVTYNSMNFNIFVYTSKAAGSITYMNPTFVEQLNKNGKKISFINLAYTGQETKVTPEHLKLPN